MIKRHMKITCSSCHRVSYVEIARLGSVILKDQLLELHCANCHHHFSIQFHN